MKLLCGTLTIVLFVSSASAFGQVIIQDSAVIPVVSEVVITTPVPPAMPPIAPIELDFYHTRDIFLSSWDGKAAFVLKGDGTGTATYFFAHQAMGTQLQKYCEDTNFVYYREINGPHKWAFSRANISWGCHSVWIARPPLHPLDCEWSHFCNVSRRTSW